MRVTRLRSVPLGAALLALACVLAVPSTPANAAGPVSCEDREAPVQPAIEACNKRLNGKSLSAHERAVAHYFRASHLIRNEALDKAMTDCEKAIEHDPSYALGFNCRGYVHLLRRKDDQAIVDFTRAIELDPNLKRAYGNRASVLARKEQFNRALADYEQVIRIDPSDPTGYTGRGAMYEQIGEFEHARLDYEAALSLPTEPSSQWAHKAARELLAHLGPVR